MSRRPTTEETSAVHARANPGRLAPVVNPPIQRGSTVLASSARALYDHSELTYGRMGLEPHAALCEALAALEGGSATFLYPSGLAAVTGVLMALLRSGDEVLALDTVYDPTRRFLNTHLQRYGVKTRFVDVRLSPAEMIAQAGENTRLVMIESPGSLTMDMVDVPALAALAHERDILVVVDGTYGAGVLNKPLAMGADVSLQALTKYVGGHADCFMGSAVTADDRLAKRLYDGQLQIGWSCSPEDVYLMQRGLRTLHTRLARHGDSAMKVAAWLAGRQKVRQVLCPALPGASGHELFARDYTGANGLFSFVLTPGDEAAVEGLLDRLQVFGLGFSWGGFESLAINCDPQFGHRVFKRDFGGPVIRLHIGLENADDLIADLDQALAGYP